MNRLDIIKAVSRILSTRRQAEKVVRTVFDSIAQSLKNDQKVVISNFGTFRVKRREARQGRNPKTGAAVSVPPRRAVRFKASRHLLS